MSDKFPTTIGKVELFSDEELQRLFQYLGHIKDVALSDLQVEMFGELIDRGFEPANLTYLDDDSDCVVMDLDPLTGDATLSISEEYFKPEID